MGLNKILTFLGDLFFSAASLLIIYYFAQKANYLQWRLYLFGGNLLGLIIYLYFFSSYITKIFNGLLELIVGLWNLMIKAVTAFGYGVTNILTLMMAVPYGILRWSGLLFFRIGEAIAKESATKVRARITKNPKQ